MGGEWDGLRQNSGRLAGRDGRKLQHCEADHGEHLWGEVAAMVAQLEIVLHSMLRNLWNQEWIRMGCVALQIL